MIAQGSLRFILPPLLLGVILVWFIPWLSLIFFGMAIYFTWFFRDPLRSTLEDDELILAAADGKVIEVIQTPQNLKIAIRMSPFDVHLNRSPLAGKVVEIVYKPGLHRSVYFAGAEDKNEQNLITIEHEVVQVEVLQITGAFARRIECWVSEDDILNQGQKIGIIRFGSQTNVLITPIASDIVKVNPLVSMGDPVKAGLTPIANIEDENL